MFFPPYSVSSTVIIPFSAVEYMCQFLGFRPLTVHTQEYRESDTRTQTLHSTWGMATQQMVHSGAHSSHAVLEATGRLLRGKCICGCAVRKGTRIKLLLLLRPPTALPFTRWLVRPPCMYYLPDLSYLCLSEVRQGDFLLPSMFLCLSGAVRGTCTGVQGKIWDIIMKYQVGRSLYRGVRYESRAGDDSRRLELRKVFPQLTSHRLTGYVDAYLIKASKLLLNGGCFC